MVQDKKIDKNLFMAQLKSSLENESDKKSSTNNAILKEIDNGQFNDALLDEQILGEDDSQEEGMDDEADVEDQQIAIEAHHQSSNTNNLYKFRNPDLLVMSERPKTTNGVIRSTSNDGTHPHTQQTAIKNQIHQTANGEAQSRAMAHEISQKYSEENKSEL